MRNVFAAAIGAGVLAAAVNTATAQAQENTFYKGKTLNLLVLSGPGGGTGVWARYMAEFLPEHIPGSHTVLVGNRPGGGSIIGANQFLDRPSHSAHAACLTTRMPELNVRPAFAQCAAEAPTAEAIASSGG